MRGEDNRLDPPRWRHDAYTLRLLRATIEAAVRHLRDAGVLHAGGARVVDFGAGEAPYRPLFEPHCEAYLACDLAPASHVDIVFQPGEPLDIDAHSVDCVVSFQVLEHVWDLDAYLGECLRVLKPHGQLLLSTHGTWLYHPHPEDFRRWTCDGLRRELETRGFEILSLDGIVGPLAWTTQFRALAYHHVLRRMGVLGRGLARLLGWLLYARMVVEDLVTPLDLRRTNAAVYVIRARRRADVP